MTSTSVAASLLKPRLRLGEAVERAIAALIVLGGAAWVLLNFVDAPKQCFSVLLIGLNNGALYALVALGYTLVYGIIELINFAHGDLFMLGTVFSANLLVNWLGIDKPGLAGVAGLLLTFVATMVFCATINMGAEFFAYRRLRRAPKLAPLITAVGLSFVFQNAKSQNPDCVYIGGIYDNNGGQLVKDKVSVLGDNTKVKMLGPDGFTGYPDLDKQPESQGMYMTFAGLSTTQLVQGGGAAAKLIDAYKAKYHALPASNYALYAVAAVQVILAAIAKSDGTRKSVTDQVFSGAGIDIPAAESMLGKEIKIDPATGDTNNKDISVLVMKKNVETFFKAQPVV